MWGLTGDPDEHDVDAIEEGRRMTKTKRRRCDQIKEAFMAGWRSCMENMEYRDGFSSEWGWGQYKEMKVGQKNDAEANGTCNDLP